ncbi:MAG: hypothetical protein ACI8ZN_000691 [Bacteroidia bacterium]|jgi:hypothetical protein
MKKAIPFALWNNTIRMNRLQILFTAAAFMLLLATSQAQIGVLPLHSNPILQNHTQNQGNSLIETRLNKWAFRDTLTIPFFEDFTSSTLFPDSLQWQDDDVYVNSDFPFRPPTYGVATFDFLDNTGKTYNTISTDGTHAADTLTSQAINLQDSFGKTYSVADSFFLSFFYQAIGFGDFITDKDEFALDFLDNAGKWHTVWSVTGLNPPKEFTQVLIAIDTNLYLHNAFQFRFSNITRRWGNNNHWHLDYIYLDKSRSKSNTFYPDYAIQTKPTSLLKNYFSIPYDHFLTDPSGQSADTNYFAVSNMGERDINANVKCEESFNKSIIYTTDFSINAGNVPSAGFANRKIKSYDFSSLSGPPYIIDRVYSVRDAGVTNRKIFQINDNIHTQQIFDRYYAYDDGSAESGFGFNDLRGVEGQMAIEFNLLKADTLQAINLFLTYNTKDVSSERITFKIWQDVAIDGGSDVVLYESFMVVGSLYKNISINGFYTLPLDSALVLPAGTFYVGWSQEKDFNLNVGYDKSNGNIAKPLSANKRILFNIDGTWIRNSEASLSGAPMIRPILGRTEPWSTSIPSKVVHNQQVRVYPNPTNSILNVPNTAVEIEIVDVRGTVVMHAQRTHSIDVSSLMNGMYLIRMVDDSSKLTFSRFIKID